MSNPLNLKIVYRPPTELRHNPRNARSHSPKQVAQIASSIAAFGFTNPVLIDEAGEIIAGHGRVAAALLSGLIKILESIAPLTTLLAAQNQRRVMR
jgi:ParB-like chromosome segregation protein Spo0J